MKTHEGRVALSSMELAAACEVAANSHARLAAIASLDGQRAAKFGLPPPLLAHLLSRAELLQAALEALDQADAARAVIAVEGMVSKTETTGALHVHPLAKVEKESRHFFLRAWAAMSLTWSHDLDGG